MRLLLLCVAVTAAGCDLGAIAGPKRPKEFIDLKPHTETKTPAASKPVVYFYTQKSCIPCKPKERYWEARKWETGSFKVERVDLGEPHDAKHDWVQHTPCYGWWIGDKLWSIEDGRPDEQVEGSWKATNK